MNNWFFYLQYVKFALVLNLRHYMWSILYPNILIVIVLFNDLELNEGVR